MPARQKPYKLGDPYHRVEALEWSASLEDLNDLWEDLGDLENYLTRKLHLFQRCHPNQTHVLKYLNKFQMRVRAYRQDLYLIRKAYRDGIDRYEHIGGPVRFDKSARIFEYGFTIHDETPDNGDSDESLEDIYG